MECRVDDAAFGGEAVKTATPCKKATLDRDDKSAEDCTLGVMSGLAGNLPTEERGKTGQRGEDRTKGGRSDNWNYQELKLFND